MRWCSAGEDGTARFADPEPQYHLSVWWTDRGWLWHVLGPRDEEIAGDYWAVLSLEAAQQAAEDAYRQHVSRR